MIKSHLTEINGIQVYYLINGDNNYKIINKSNFVYIASRDNYLVFSLEENKNELIELFKSDTNDDLICNYSF